LDNVFTRIIGSRVGIKAYDSERQWNLADCALAEPLSQAIVKNEILDVGLAEPLSQAIVKNEILDIGIPRWVDDPPVEVGMSVQKSGRTTALTTGKVTGINVSVVVGYPGDRKAYFMDQIMTGSMAQGGDSGSALCDMDKNIMGLLFAGSNEATFHNRIQNVRQELGF